MTKQGEISRDISKYSAQLGEMYITCKKCSYTDDESFFKSSVSRARGTIHHFHVCLMCVQEEQDTKKRGNRTIPKARNILWSHCERYNRQNGTSLKPSEFARKFGWDLRQMTHDIEHAFDNWCPYCEGAYHSMEHGFAAVTLDIIDPAQPPYYTNVRFCCATCNRRKGQLGPTAFGRFLASVKRRREFLNSGYGTVTKPQYRMDLEF